MNAKVLSVSAIVFCLLMLVWVCVWDVPVSVAAGHEDRRDLVFKKISTGDAAERLAAIRGLDNYEASEAVIRALADAAGDEDIRVRNQALLSLSRHGEVAKVALPAIRQAGSNAKSHDKVFASLAEALVSGDPAGGVAALAEGLRSDDQKIRGMAALLCGEMGSLGKTLVPDMVRALSDDDFLVVKAARMSLSEIGVAPQVLMAAVIEGLAHEDVAHRARWALWCAEIGTRAAPAVPHLIALMADPSEEVRYTAIETLARIAPDTPEVREALIDGLCSDDLGLQYHCGLALSEIGAVDTPNVQAKLKTLLATGSEPMQAMAAVALLQMDSAADAPRRIVRAMLESPVEQTRGYIGEALDRGAKRMEWPVSLFRLAMVHANPDVRVGAASSVQNWGDAAHAAIGELAGCLADTEEEVSGAAFHSLWAMLRTMSPQTAKTPGGMAVLRRTLLAEAKSADYRRRIQSAELLGYLPSDAVGIASLSQLLDDPYEGVRHSAASSLCRLNARIPRAVIISIHRIFNNDDYMDVGGVAEALGKQGWLDEGSKAKVKSALNSCNKTFRLMAAQVLMGLPSERAEAIAVLLRLMEDPDGTFRSYAGIAFSQCRLDSLPDAAIEALARGVQDSDASVRYWSCKVLMKLGAKSTVAIEALKGALRDQSSVSGVYVADIARETLVKAGVEVE